MKRKKVDAIMAYHERMKMHMFRLLLLAP